MSGATVTGAVSRDGTQWTTVGSWTLAWLPTSATALGAYAPPLALAAGENISSLPATSAPGAASWQRFTSVGLFASAPPLAGTTTTITPLSAHQISAQFSGFSVVPAAATGQVAPGAAG